MGSFLFVNDITKILFLLTSGAIRFFTSVLNPRRNSLVTQLMVVVVVDVVVVVVVVVAVVVDDVNTQL